MVSDRTHIEAVLRLGAPLVAIAGALSWSQPSIPGSDLWWHLATGRDIVRLGGVPQTDIYSYTFYGERWLNPEWLWAVMMWVSHRVWPQAVAWLNLAIVAAVFGLAYANATRTTGSRLGAGAAIWLAAATSFWFIDIRPHLLTLVLLGIFLLTRERAWAPWLWPVLIVLWVNVHGGYPFGVGAIGLYVVIRTIEHSIQARRVTVSYRHVAGLVLAILAVGINPFGYTVVENPLDYLDPTTPFRTLVEWRAPRFGMGFGDYAGRFWIASIATVLALPFVARRHAYLVALCFVTFIMAVSARRFIPLFALTAAPLIAAPVAAAQAFVARRWRELDSPRTGLASTAVAALVALLLWHNTRISPDLLGRWTKIDVFPEAALQYLVALGAPERVFCNYPWAGYLMLHAPQMKVFIDGRANTVYGDEIYLDYLSMMQSPAALRDRFAHYDADVALLGAWSPPVQALRHPPFNWRLVYTDEVAAILLPPDSPHLAQLPDWTTVLGDDPERDLIMAEVERRNGNLDAAIASTRRALAKQPLLVRGYRKLGLIAQQRGDLDGIRAAMNEGIAAYPRRIEDFRHIEGLLYEQAGDYRRALRAYREAIPTGPFINPEGIERGIQGLEKRLADTATAP
jgi:tetratricopeptide (TPR) repeat protein